MKNEKKRAREPKYPYIVNPHIQKQNDGFARYDEAISGLSILCWRHFWRKIIIYLWIPWILPYPLSLVSIQPEGIFMLIPILSRVRCGSEKRKSKTKINNNVLPFTYDRTESPSSSLFFGSKKSKMREKFFRLAVLGCILSSNGTST